MSTATATDITDTTLMMPDWRGASRPTATLVEGRFVRLEKLDPSRHGDSLWRAFEGPGSDPDMWSCTMVGPFPDRGSFDRWLDQAAAAVHDDAYFFAIVDRADGTAVGTISLATIVPEHGTIEIAYVYFGARMQRTAMGTEAVYLIVDHCFERLGYRRVEWRCNRINARSNRAARRYGFTFEGMQRQKSVVKGKSRDDTLYAMLDSEWPAIKSGFVRWLSDDNQGRSSSGQVKTLAECRSLP